MKRSLQQIADAVGARLIGDGGLEVAGVASITSATPGDLVFVGEEKHLPAALQCQAGAVIAGDFAQSASSSKPLLISDHPKLAFARAARLLQQGAPLEKGVHKSAVVPSSAVFGSGVQV